MPQTPCRSDNRPHATGLILGIESSCDETAAAVVRDGTRGASNVVATRSPSTPTTAASSPSSPRANTSATSSPSSATPCAEAGVSFADLDAIAVTEGPGLAGALLVGITYAKALAFGLGKPLIGVNHLEGHIHAVLMEARQRSESPIDLPAARARRLRRPHPPLPRQQAAQQAPGTTATSAAPSTTPPAKPTTKSPSSSASATPAAPGSTRSPRTATPAPSPSPSRQSSTGRIATAARSQQKSPAPADGPRFDFSFSGIKTAVLRYVADPRHAATASKLAAAQRRPRRPRQAQHRTPSLALCDPQTLDLIASFQYAVVGNLLRQTFAAAEALRRARHPRLRRRRRQPRTPPPLHRRSRPARPPHRLPHRSRSPPTTPP